MQRTPNPGSAHSMLQDPIDAGPGGSRWASGGMGPSPGGHGSLYSPKRAPGDPRASSTQSLVSSMGSVEDGRKRRLLVVYIHGYMGDRSSFRSFPAHVHSFLKDLLAESHVIHTKIYPRYKTYKSIEVARDNFSNWLTPHESPTTDVVLIGHSMGGLLAAEVVLSVCVPGCG
jgi:pimeloyl-ACP methyl ester carboxylesterase